MQKNNHNSHPQLVNFSQFKWYTVILSCMLLSACGNDYPKLTHFKAFDERFNTVIDTKDAAQLATLSELFFDRRESNDVTANLDFQYLIDMFNYMLLNGK